ncbi:dienelactone hydrolase family protein [Geodermatophilus sp. SYSU D01036]
MPGEVPVDVPAPGAVLAWDLAVPPAARGVVLCAHGSGSSRHSPRNRQVAAALQRAGRATLLLDLLTPAEEAVDDRTRELRSDVGLLTGRLTAALDWLGRAAATAGLPPDLAGEALSRVRAPTLLVVGGADRQVLALNRDAAARLGGPSELAVVPGATHLFPEPGALAQVVDRTLRWLDRWPPGPQAGSPST